jgi:hypothetical protein
MHHCSIDLKKESMDTSVFGANVLMSKHIHNEEDQN